MVSRCFRHSSGHRLVQLECFSSNSRSSNNREDGLQTCRFVDCVYVRRNFMNFVTEGLKPNLANVGETHQLQYILYTGDTPFSVSTVLEVKVVKVLFGWLCA